MVNWNGKDLLRSSLQSLKIQSHKDLEIIVVDNGSTDGSVEMISKEFPGIRLVENSMNLGFARPNNQGMAQAEGESFFLINNDAAAEKECLARLVSALDDDPETGMVAPKIINEADGKIIDSVGGLFIYPDGMSRGRGRGEEDHGQYDGLKEILMPSACACLYRKAMIDEVGNFDEDFYAYCEDTDLGLRGQLAGWKAVSVSNAVVHHKYSKTGGKYSPLKAFLVERNHIWVVWKNLPLSLLLLTPVYAKWRYFLQVIAALVRKGAGGSLSRSIPQVSCSGSWLKLGGRHFWGCPRCFRREGASGPRGR